MKKERKGWVSEGRNKSGDGGQWFDWNDKYWIGDGINLTKDGYGGRNV
jgi:hypothetical protein